MSATAETMTQINENPEYRLVVNGQEYRRSPNFEELEKLLIWQSARIEERRAQGWEIVS